MGQAGIGAGTRPDSVIQSAAISYMNPRDAVEATGLPGAIPKRSNPLRATFAASKTLDKMVRGKTWKR